MLPRCSRWRRRMGGACGSNRVSVACVFGTEDRNRRPCGTPLLIGRHLLPAARPWPAGPLGERRMLRPMTSLPRIYVTGHRNPDTDSIGAAVGYAELMGRLDPHNEYVPVRLGEVNTQTRWVLERSGAAEPEFLPHVMLRVRDVMRERFPQASHGEPIREVGRLMAREDMDLVPIVDGDGALVGVMTE